MKKKIISLSIVFIIFFFALSKLYPISGYQEERIPILMYHHLDNNLNNNAVISPKNFELQIKTLKEEGYNTITVHQLHDYLYSNGNLPKNPVLITFDDGYLSNYETAYPILKKYNMHAEIFIITSRILEKNEENPYTNEIPKMNWDQLKEMRNHITIQSHTWDSHYKLDSRNGKQYGAIYGPGYINGKLENQDEYEKRVISDLIRSKKVITDKLGYEPIAISYPFGSKSKQTEELSKKAGFKMAFVIEDRSVKKGENIFALSRITVNGNDTGRDLIKKIKK